MEEKAGAQDSQERRLLRSVESKVKKNLFIADKLEEHPTVNDHSQELSLDDDQQEANRENSQGATPEVQYGCEIYPGTIDCVEEEVQCYVEEANELKEPCSDRDQETKRGNEKNVYLMSALSFKDDDTGVYFYTGLETYSKFLFVFSTLCPEAESLKYVDESIKNLPEDAFLLTSMKLRRNKALYVLHRFFGLTEQQVSDLFFTWINFMSDMWSMLDLWPSRELVSFFMPEGYKCSYPSTRVIVEATEVPIEKPKNPAAQQASFSNYKNKNTVKVEVGAPPPPQDSYLICLEHMEEPQVIGKLLKEVA